MPYCGFWTILAFDSCGLWLVDNFGLWLVKDLVKILVDYVHYHILDLS